MFSFLKPKKSSYQALDAENKYDFSQMPRDEKEIDLYLQQAIKFIDAPLKLKTITEEDIEAVIGWPCFNQAFADWIREELLKLKPEASRHEFVLFLGSDEDLINYYNCHLKTIDKEYIAELENDKEKIPAFKAKIFSKFRQQCREFLPYLAQQQIAPEFQTLLDNCKQLQTNIADNKPKLDAKKKADFSAQLTGLIFRLDNSMLKYTYKLDDAKTTNTVSLKRS